MKKAKQTTYQRGGKPTKTKENKTKHPHRFSSFIVLVIRQHRDNISIKG